MGKKALILERIKEDPSLRKEAPELNLKERYLHSRSWCRERGGGEVRKSSPSQETGRAEVHRKAHPWVKQIGP